MKVASWMECGALLLLGMLPALGYGQQPSLTLRRQSRRLWRQNPQTAAARCGCAQRGGAGFAGADGAVAAAERDRRYFPRQRSGLRLRHKAAAAAVRAERFFAGFAQPADAHREFCHRLSGQWMLFNGLATQRQIRAAQAGRRQRQVNERRRQQGVVFEVVQAYQSVLYAQRQMDVAQHEQETAEALLHDAQTRVKARAWPSTRICSRPR